MIALTAVFLTGTASVFAGSYKQGEPMDSFQAKDQHGAVYDFQPIRVKYLLVSHDMDTGKKANVALTELGKDFLPRHGAVYLANIHGMPAIGRRFALPKMKKYLHRIVLGDDTSLMERFPQEAGKVTVIGISGGKVRSIRYWSPGTESVGDYLK
ncbi:MAG: hypothetical protein QM627_07320 [Luteolibacter sp.]